MRPQCIAREVGTGARPGAFLYMNVGPLPEIARFRPGAALAGFQARGAAVRVLVFVLGAIGCRFRRFW